MKLRSSGDTFTLTGRAVNASSSCGSSLESKYRSSSVAKSWKKRNVHSWSVFRWSRLIVELSLQWTCGVVCVWLGNRPLWDNIISVFERLPLWLCFLHLLQHLSNWLRLVCQCYRQEESQRWISADMLMNTCSLHLSDSLIVLSTEEFWQHESSC